MVPNNIHDQSLVLFRRLQGIYKRRHTPEQERYQEKIAAVMRVMESENSKIRPRDSFGKPGGIIYLYKDLPTVIVPDLHARMDFFLSIMVYKLEGGSTILRLLDEEKIQIVCVGDGFHAEKRAALRWRYALAEYRTYYKKHKNMDEEMRESLGLMEMVMELKTTYPDRFHFIKGNHENISNENANGNRPFGKFAYEGEMVKVYMQKFYPEPLIRAYYQFERALPLLVVGRNFLISHAEPRIFHPENSILNYTQHPEVVYDLTWTADNVADENSVFQMLTHYLQQSAADPCFYFGGHRPVRELYNLRANGKYVQIHNPDKFILAFLKADKPIELTRDVIEIPDYKQ